ncbi:MAG: hypothetical protein K2I39_06850 [Muribaculaceae bacterium]|nr:hypothetical protein [Muribaculaceae bacterium]
MMRNLVTGGLILISAMCAPIAEGAKIYQLTNARVYHKDGTVREYGGDSMLSMPRKKDALQPVEKAYTKAQKKTDEIAPAKVDSVVVWLPTVPDKRYTFVYLPKYGWSTVIDKAPQSNSYVYSDGGFRLRPDGGLWFYDTQKLIVERDGTYKDLKNPYDQSPEKFAEKVAKISDGDTALEARLKYLLGREYPGNYVRMVKMDGDTVFGYLHYDAKTIAKKENTLLRRRHKRNTMVRQSSCSEHEDILVDEFSGNVQGKQIYTRLLLAVGQTPVGLYREMGSVGDKRRQKPGEPPRADRQRVFRRRQRSVHALLQRLREHCPALELHEESGA